MSPNAFCSYWTCKCGSWTFCPKEQCHGCGRAPPKRDVQWIRRTKQPNQPTPPKAKEVKADADGFVVEGKSKKERRAAKRAAAESAETPEKSTRNPGSEGDDTSMGDEENADKLAEATQELADLEAVPESVRKLVPDFDAKVAAAKAKKEAAQQSKRDAKPWKWRVLDAEKQAKKAISARVKVDNDAEALHKEILEKQAELARLAQSRPQLLLDEETAKQKFAAIKAEGAPQPPPVVVVQAPAVPGEIRTRLVAFRDRFAGLPAAFSANTHKRELDEMFQQINCMCQAEELPAAPPAQILPPQPVAPDGNGAAPMG